MGKTKIIYSVLEESKRQANRVENEINGYISEIRSHISQKIINVPGDSSQYVSTATTLAQKKINSLSTLGNKYSSYRKTISTFIDDAKRIDSDVSKRIEEKANQYIGRRNFVQKIGDWVYETFCVDFGNSNEVLRDIKDVMVWTGTKAIDKLEKVHNYFKYGDGKYIWNIGKAIVGAGVAVAGAIAAIASIPVTGPIAIVVGCISAGAAIIGGAITIYNASAQVEGNAKALTLKKENPGAARYYGNISKKSDYWKKTDMGGKSSNDRYKVIGEVVDKTKVVADVTGAVAGVAQLGYVHDYRFKDNKVKGWSWSKENIKKNLLHDMGYKVSSKELDIKKAFNPFKNLFASSYDKNKFSINGELMISERLVKSFRGLKVTNNMVDLMENVDAINDYYKNDEAGFGDMWKTIGKTTDIFSNMKWYSPIDNVVDVIDKSMKVIGLEF